MKTGGWKPANPVDFFDADSGAQYWTDGTTLIFEIVYDDVTGKAWGCAVTQKMLQDMGIPSLSELASFLDGHGVRARTHKAGLNSRAGGNTEAYRV